MLAAKLGTHEASLRKEVQRLRHRYGELLREEIARTVASPAEVEDELCHLFTVLSA
jgi:RNA polymerase sigma-70 factor (ECF subfamily)